MLRAFAISSLFSLLLCSCGPDKQPCSSQGPAFTVLLELTARPLPSDTVVRVNYAGSGKEEFRLSNPNAKLQVTFCRRANLDGTLLDASAPAASDPDGSAGDSGAAGASGSAGAASEPGDPSSTVPALKCDLWTAGFTKLEVSGTGFMTMDYELTPKQQNCTVVKELVLDDPDAG